MTKPDLRVEIVRDASRLAEIGEAWNALSARAAGSVFQSHGWIAAWVSAGALASGWRLRVALGWDDATLVAVMPLAIRRRRGLRLLEWAAQDQTDYCDILIGDERVGDGRDAAAVARRLWSAVAAAGGFDLAHLGNVAPDAACRGLFAEPTTGFRSGRRRDVSLRVTASGDGAAWFASLSKKTRQNHRRSAKAMDEFGAWSFREIGRDEAIGPVIARLADLKSEWLIRSELSSAILETEAASLKASVAVLERAGLLRLFVIECDGRVVAGSVNFVEGGRMMAFFNAYDPALERASPGTLLMVEYIKQAFDEGLSEVDFLRGAEEYKLRFAGSRIALEMAVTGRTLLGRIALATDERDLGKALRQALAAGSAALDAALAAPRLIVRAATGRLRRPGPPRRVADKPS